MENKLIQVVAATPRLKIGDIKYNTKEILDIINESSVRMKRFFFLQR